MKALAVAGLLLCAVSVADAAVDPWAATQGPLRIEGPVEMKGVVARWVASFTRRNPQIRVEVQLRGTDVGLGALVTGRTDIALAGRDATEPEIKAFEWIFRYQPTAIDIMSGSLDHPGRSPALAVLVSRDNPLGEISVRQLAQLFTPGQGGLRTWGEVGGGNGWASHPVHLVMPGAETGTGVFFRDRILAGARALPWDHLTEVEDRGEHDAARRIAETVEHDRYALAVAPLSAKLPVAVKVLPVVAEGQAAVTPSVETVVSRAYVLGRVVHAYVNAAPAQPVDPSRAHPLDPRAAQFLKYVLSSAGQRDVEDSKEYLPLVEQEALAQVKRW